MRTRMPPARRSRGKRGRRRKGLLFSGGGRPPADPATGRRAGPRLRKRRGAESSSSSFVDGFMGLQYLDATLGPSDSAEGAECLSSSSSFVASCSSHHYLRRLKGLEGLDPPLCYAWLSGTSTRSPHCPPWIWPCQTGSWLRYNTRAIHCRVDRIQCLRERLCLQNNSPNLLRSARGHHLRVQMKGLDWPSFLSSSDLHFTPLSPAGHLPSPALLGWAAS